MRAVRGTVIDVAVDLRSNSEIYGKRHGVILSAENEYYGAAEPPVRCGEPRNNQRIRSSSSSQMGAYGFMVLSDEAEFCYKVND